MIGTIYIESAVAGHPRARAVRERFAHARVVECRHYGEVFNRRNQSFRVQKGRPALILAAKHNRRVLPVPAGYGLDGADGYYFSHLLNCLYDCRYCFLQGQFRSAHYVLFVNYEDFVDDIRRASGETSAPVWFFSGYDCDSLALEPVTGFAAHFLPALDDCPNAWLELRTKSTQVGVLAALDARPRCVVAFSLSPAPVIAAFESRTPTLAARLDAVERLLRRGWPVGLRFDPVLVIENATSTYGAFFDEVFRRIDGTALHSVTLGAFRLPVSYAKVIRRMYPDAPLLARPWVEAGGQVAHPGSAALVAWCRERIAAAVPRERIFVQGASHA